MPQVKCLCNVLSLKRTVLFHFCFFVSFLWVDYFPDGFLLGCLKAVTVFPHLLKRDDLIFIGVALLPFVDERRLRAALEEVYPDLTPEESKTYTVLL